ncbi:Protein of unknown function (DUF2457) [Teratosphaeria destructans]|uniref:Uncharacterized protein n=1 Tax=Teratosphaeria destructans TaxID=418781 RepID=A0A9W7SLV8_9PEZI|nr:Protein of unknown function (DUF2457) [Teratosphaeria destructans]
MAFNGMDQSEDLLAEVDEPPDHRQRPADDWSVAKLEETYRKARPQEMQNRRESLLTRQLHSETEHSDEADTSSPKRALSTQSTWSTTSTAELTSDDGHSVPSPAISPPLPPTHARIALPLMEKSLSNNVKIVGHEDSSQAEAGSEKTVEATLGRKRCIMFACGGKQSPKPTDASPPPPAQPEAPASPPKRKCMITFACTAKPTSDSKPVSAKRPLSPAPPERRSSGLKSEAKQHRGSDSTVTHSSPKSVRRSPSMNTSASSSATPQPSRQTVVRKMSNDSNSGAEAMRFHEFASSDDEPEEWVQEATCHRSRLTITDTLKKENVIRKACEEVEEEVIDEEDDEDEDDADEADGEDQDEQEEEDRDEEDEESEHSDAGFHSDDEQGFADSDSDGEGSDYEWWKPGGSTAATSVEHLDRLHIAQAKNGDNAIPSSVGSASSGYLSPQTKQPRHHVRRRSKAMPIRRPEEDLPDSTDFVCGTLDEDKPMEQAYLNRIKSIEAARHVARPQDIDPSFPTSDPEMDEEDDDDLEDPEQSEDDLVHGQMEELDDGEHTLGRRPSVRSRTRAQSNRSPPPTRYHSPPPPTKKASKHHSPPPTAKRGTARSPPPRKLFGNSPKRARSPAPVKMTSPPNSLTRAEAFAKHSKGLAQRPQLTHTASLPRGGFLHSAMAKMHFDDGEGSDTVGPHDMPKRRAIDIYKGLEKKRLRRKEKLWLQRCVKNAAKAERPYKVKPGRGAERMREIGLEMQRYLGKEEAGTHILSL